MVKIIELKTTQSSAIKILVDTLNSLLTDVNITFYPTQDTVVDSNDSDDSEYEDSSDDENDSCEKKKKQASKKGGVVIKEVNKTITVLVYCKLDGLKNINIITTE